MRYAWYMAGELGRESVENLASEPSEPADGLLIERLSLTFTGKGFGKRAAHPHPNFLGVPPFRVE